MPILLDRDERICLPAVQDMDIRRRSLCAAHTSRARGNADGILYPIPTSSHPSKAGSNQGTPLFLYASFLLGATRHQIWDTHAGYKLSCRSALADKAQLLRTAYHHKG